MGYTRHDGLLVTGRKFIDFTTVSSPATAGNVTYTAAQLLGGLILRNTNGGNRSDVSPTAAQLVAALSSMGRKPVVGNSFIFTIRNTAGAAETITLTAGTGVTLSGTMTIAQNNSKDFEVVFTDVRDGNAAVTIYSLGTSTF